MKSKILSTLIPVLLVCSLIYFMGFRLDGLTAARANSFVPKDSILQDQVDYKWGTVYIFDSPEKPMTAISMKNLDSSGFQIRQYIFYVTKNQLGQLVGLV